VVGAAGFAGALGVEFGGVLSDPDDAASVVGEGFDGGVGDGCAWAE